MDSQTNHPRTEGVPNFDPDALFESWSSGSKSLPNKNDLRASIISTFHLPENDSYVYHAMASVTLSQVQVAIDQGGDSGLHAWCLDDEGKQVIDSIKKICDDSEASRT